MNTHILPEQLITQLNWRYATKRFDPSRKISESDWAALQQATLLAPSSFGIQPWAFIVVEDPAVRAKLSPVSYNQPQIVEASHLVVFASKTALSAEDIDGYVECVCTVRGGGVKELRSVPVNDLSGMRDMMVGALVKGMDEPARDAWCKNQTYIALGVLLTSAALLGIDACPMEGFDHAKYDEILGLRKRRLASAAVAALGYRSVDDKYATLKKVRFPKEQVFVRV